MALAAYPIAEAGRLGPLVDVLAVLGLLLVVASLRLGRWSGGALLALAGAYVTVDASGDVGTATVIAYAVGLFVLAELLRWSESLRAVDVADRAALAGRLSLLAALGATSVLLALVVLAATSLQLPQAFEAALLGSAAAVVLLALPVLLLGRGPRR